MTDDSAAPEEHDEAARDAVAIDVKALRERLGWTQADMAAYLRLDRSRVSRLENGGRIRGAAGKLLEELDAKHPSNAPAAEPAA